MRLTTNQKNMWFVAPTKKKKLKTMREFVPELKEGITSLLSNEKVPLETRLQVLTGILTTENNPEIKIAQSKATQIFQQMKTDVSVDGENGSKWKEKVTPCSHNFSRKIGKLRSDLEKANLLSHMEKLCNMLLHVRETQCTEISKSVLLFVNNLINCEVPCVYVLHWLQNNINAGVKSLLPLLMEEKNLVLQRFKAAQIDKCSEDVLQNESRVLQNLNDEIENVNFGVEYFLREIGHICDSALEIGRNTKTLGLPTVDEIAEMVADLTISGMSFELVDGDSGYLPKLWVQLVFRKLSSKLENPKVAVVSVLGVQSSGKSTFMNSMFGLDLAASTGRCTKGVHLRILPMKTTVQNHFPFSYLLIVDSEGLRGPELAYDNVKQTHDKELATFVTGLGDVTLINNMGENFSEMRDILETVVNAFLRLKLAGSALSLEHTCLFLHQNVTEKRAIENMRDGFMNLSKMLDTVTQESTESEGIRDIKHFNDIIKFDIMKHVFTIPNLWQGYPPMRTVSRSYTQKVQDIKESILAALLNETNKYFLSLEDFSIRATDIWTGGLGENFVFSFKNNLEIKAYYSIERELDNISWSLEMFYLNEINTTLRYCFKHCTDLKTLGEAVIAVKNIMKNKLALKRNELVKKIGQIFDNSTYKDIVIHWKANRLQKLDIRVSELNDMVSSEAAKCKIEKSISITTKLK